MDTTVGAYEAKTRLSQLLEMVARGGSVTITRHGHPIARLVPVSPARADATEVIQAILDNRQGVRRGRVSVRRMIDEGRR